MTAVVSGVALWDVSAGLQFVERNKEVISWFSDGLGNTEFPGVHESLKC